jgi:hypothetical protein
VKADLLVISNQIKRSVLQRNLKIHYRLLTGGGKAKDLIPATNFCDWNEG